MAQNLQQSAGDVRIESIYLNTGIKESIDIQNFFLEITLHESIHTPCIFGHVVVSDAVNLLTNGPIVGRDTITFKIRTPALNDTPENVIHKTFAIYAVTDRFLNSDREQFYTIQFMSIEGMKDNITRLTEKFNGSTEEIAFKLFSEYIVEPRVMTPEFKDSGDPSITILDTPHFSNNLEFVANYWSPFKCMNYVAKNTVGNEYKLPNTLFFESNKGHYFTSITALTQGQKDIKTLYDEYVYVSNLDEITIDSQDKRSTNFKYTSPFISNKMTTVSKMEYPKHFDQIENQSSGYYGSVTHGYDWTKKDIYNIKFDYTPEQPARREQDKSVLDINYDSFKHIGDINPIPKGMFANPLSKRQYKAGASGLFGNKNAFDISQVSSVCYRESSLAELDVLKYEITVPGKTDIEVGRLIKFNYPSVGDKGQSNPEYENLFDDKVSGVYIVIGIRHDIDKLGHNMILEIARDGAGEF